MRIDNKLSLPEYRTCFVARVLVDTKFHKKGDIVEIIDYHDHDGGQWIMSNGVWFNYCQIERI